MTKPEEMESLPRISLFRVVFPAVFWIILIFALSTYPKAIIPQGKFISWDKLAHIVEFGILGYLVARLGYFSRQSWWFRRWGLITIIFGILYAASDEWHQFFVPGRYSSVYDVIADAIGVFLGYMLFKTLIKKRS